LNNVIITERLVNQVEELIDGLGSQTVVGGG
jgi:hypothetical protein